MDEKTWNIVKRWNQRGKRYQDLMQQMIQLKIN